MFGFGRGAGRGVAGGRHAPRRVPGGRRLATGRAPAAFALGAQPHSDIHRRSVFDALWLASLFADVALVLSLRWLVSILTMVLWRLHLFVVERGAY